MEMNIVVASDDNYVPHLVTLICSICENNKESSLEIHILDGGILDNGKEEILKLAKNYGNLNFNWYEVNGEQIQERLGGSLSNDRSLSTYARIFIPYLLDENIQKALYLDVDGIVLGNLKEVFNTDFDEVLAGVLDFVPLERKTAVDLKKTDIYINAGVILWNLKACREKGLVNRFKEFVIQKKGNVLGMDQGTINGTLKGKIKVLPLKYNVMTPIFQMTTKRIKHFYEMESFYNQDEINEAKENPIFIHFVPAFTTRPWVEGCSHPFKEVYWKYRNLTGYGSSKLQKDTRKWKIRFVSKLYYVLPYPIYFYFIKIAKKISRLI